MDNTVDLAELATVCEAVLACYDQLLRDDAAPPPPDPNQPRVASTTALGVTGRPGAQSRGPGVDGTPTAAGGADGAPPEEKGEREASVVLPQAQGVPDLDRALAGARGLLGIPGRVWWALDLVGRGASGATPTELALAIEVLRAVAAGRSPDISDVARL